MPKVHFSRGLYKLLIFLLLLFGFEDIVSDVTNLSLNGVKNARIKSDVLHQTGINVCKIINSC